MFHRTLLLLYLIAFRTEYLINNTLCTYTVILIVIFFVATFVSLYLYSYHYMHNIQSETQKNDVYLLNIYNNFTQSL